MNLDWDDMNVLLAVARNGSLNRAGRALGLTQPTISRRLHAIEAALGLQLFERTPAGLAATAFCESLLDDIDHMEQRAQGVLRKVAANGDGVSGTITVTSIDWLGYHIVAPLLARFAALHPQLKVRLVNDERNFNLAARDADVSIAFRTLAQENLVRRRLCSIPYRLYAADDYVAGPDGAPTPLVMVERSDGSYLLDEWRRTVLPDSRVILAVNTMHSVLGAVQGGQAMGILPVPLAKRFPRLQAIGTALPGPALDLRIGFHEDMRQSPRIRALVDFLVAELQDGAAVD